MKMRDQGYEKSAHLYDWFDTKDNIPFFLHYGRGAGEILDIGAGTGRIAIPLAEAGVKVFCVEPSPAMRKVFQGKLTKKSDLRKNIVLVEGEAGNFDLGREFPAAYLSGTFDHFLDHDERVVSLLNINKHLCVGGKLIFDAFIGLMQAKPLSPAGEVVEGIMTYKRLVGVKLLSEMQLEVQLIYEVMENDLLVERIEERSYAAVMDREGILELLEKTGFSVQEEFGNYQRDLFQEGDEILIIQASKVI
jgi:SAM-dependent methyltransferase